MSYVFHACELFSHTPGGNADYAIMCNYVMNYDAVREYLRHGAIVQTFEPVQVPELDRIFNLEEKRIHGAGILKVKS